MRPIALFCVAVLFASACSSDPPTPPPEELRVAVSRVSALDPVVPSAGGGDGRALVQRQIFEGLVRADPETLRPEPALAASWTVSSDARTFTFLLRDRARFHDGEPVTAADVVAAFNRLARTACAPATSAEAGAPAFLLSAVVGYAEVAAACQAETLSGVVAVGDTTVMISLSEPWADFPAVLSNPAASIVPAGAADLGTAPVGTGPYRVSEPWDGTDLVLERSDAYWGQPASIDRIRFVGYDGDALGYLDLLQGEVHYADVPVNRAREARREFGEEGFRQGIGLAFVGTNLRSTKMHPLAFRRGLSLAVDRESVAAGIFEGTRTPADGLASPALPGVSGSVCPDLCTYDAAEARRLVAEAYPQGPPEVILGVPSEGINPAVGEALVRMFADVGVPVRLLERPFAAHVRGVEAGDVDLYAFGWVPAFPALDALLRPLFRSGSPDNLARYRDDGVDRMLQEARAIVDEQRRLEAYRQIERRILAGAPVIPLVWYRSSVAFDERLVATSDAPLVDGLGLTSFADLAWRGAGG